MKYIVDLKRLQKYAFNRCPCLVPSTDKNKDPNELSNICPCKTFLDSGDCRCKLFVKVEENGNNVQ